MITYSMHTRQKSFSVENVINEAKYLVGMTEQGLEEADEKFLYKTVLFRIVKAEEEGKYILMGETEKKYKTCGYTINHTLSQKPGKINIKLLEILPPNDNAVICEGEGPATLRGEIELEQLLGNELNFSRNLLVDKYIVELDKEEIKISPQLGLFSKPF